MERRDDATHSVFMLTEHDPLHLPQYQRREQSLAWHMMDIPHRSRRGRVPDCYDDAAHHSATDHDSLPTMAVQTRPGQD